MRLLFPVFSVSLFFLMIFASGCVVQKYVCDNGSIVENADECRPQYYCGNGSIVSDPSLCKPQMRYVCMNGTIMESQTACVECAADKDCVAWKECRQGRCEVRSGMCDSNGDCKTGWMCVEHVCVPIKGYCGNDNDCESYEECRNGICTVKAARCRGDSDCATYEYCANNTCTLMPGRCRIETECGWLMSCSDHECVENCTLGRVGTFYSEMIHWGSSEIRDAAAAAINSLNIDIGDEARVYKEQLSANLENGRVSISEYNNIYNSIAAYLFVHNNISYALGAPGSATAQDDITTLRRRIGKCDEKSILLISMLDSIGINATMGVKSTEGKTCATIDCNCFEKLDHAYVEIYLPEFEKLVNYVDKMHYTNTTFCSRQGWIAIDPTCSGCPFAWATDCGYLPIELKR